MRPALLLLALLLCSAPVRAQDVAAALTDEVVEVTAGFSGAKVVLFGALIDAELAIDDASPLDLVAVLRGPKTDFRIRPMQQSGMIWTRGPAISVEGAPSLLVSSATRPLDEIAPPKTLADLRIGWDRSAIGALIRPRTERAAAHVGEAGASLIGAAFLDVAYESGRYGENIGAVEFEKGKLFRIDLNLPPGTPVGAYFVDVYLFRDGALLAHDAASLTVGKVGIERAIFEFAHDYAALYGVFCVALSLALGWLAAAAFRK